MKLVHCATAIAGRLTPVLICAAALLAVGVATNDTTKAGAGNGPVFAIDMDITGGACSTIDSSRTQATGSFQAAVCLVNNPGGVAVAAFQFRVLYDDTVIVAPEVANTGSALDDNPDANIGATSFSSPNLGTDPNSWTCATVGAFPVGDANAAAGSGEAFSGGCGNESGAGVTLVEGPLSVITFNVVGSGSTALTLASTSATDNDLAEIGSCNPTQETAATCTNATFSTAAGLPTNTPVGPTNTPPPATNTPGIQSQTPVTNQSSSTPTPSATGQATVAPGETPGAPPPPPGGPGAAPTRTGTGRPGSGVTGPDTGDGPSGGSGGTDNLVLLAASGAVFLAAGAGVAWRRRRVRADD